MTPRVLEGGDVVQIDPHHQDPMFAGCLLVVTEPKAWGVQGYVQMLGTDSALGGLVYYRVEWADIEYVGKARWVAQGPVPGDTTD